MVTSSFLLSFYFACGVIIFFLAVTILRQNVRNIVNWSTALVLFFAGFGPILGALGVLLEQNPKQGTIIFKNLVASFDYIWEFFFPSLVLLALVHPRRHRLWRYFRNGIVVLFLPYLFHLVLMIFLLDRVNPEAMFHAASSLPGPLEMLEPFTARAASLGNVFMELLFKAHKQLFSLVNLAYAGFSMVLLVRSLRGDLAPRVRRQIHMIIAGLGLCILTFSGARLVPVLAGIPINDRTSTLFINAALIIGGGSIAYTIVRYQFLDMRLIARKGILYAAAAVMFATAYLLVIRQITGFFKEYSASSVQILETGFIILFIIAFQPILGRIEEWSEKVLIAGGTNPRARIAGLSGELLSIIDTAALRERVRAVLGEVFQADSVELVLREEFAGDERPFPVTAEMMDTFEAVGEPMTRSDFLEAMGYDAGRGGFLHPGRRRSAADLLDALPGEVQRFARFDLIVPIIHQEECAATLLLGPRREHDRYSAEEHALIAMLASQIASSLANIDLLKEVVEKRVMEEELSIARAIQLNLLPQEPPVLERYDLSALSISSKQVGGDYYDFLHRGHLLAVAVADVSGKGVPASLLMASLQASLRSNLARMEYPVEIISKLNDMMCETTTEDKFATMFYGCLDMEANAFHYTNAGHTFPCLSAGKNKVTVLDYSGLILGVIRGFIYEEKVVAFEPGDVLVITTDGVTEAMNEEGDLFGEERLYTLLRTLYGKTAAEVKEAIVDTVHEFSSPRGASDDLTILVLRRVK